MILKDLKASSHCIQVVKTSNKILGTIRRTFTYETKENLSYTKSLVRSHRLLYAGVEPSFKMDIVLLGVQHRAIKMI